MLQAASLQWWFHHDPPCLSASATCFPPFTAPAWRLVWRQISWPCGTKDSWDTHQCLCDTCELADLFIYIEGINCIYEILQFQNLMLQNKITEDFFWGGGAFPQTQQWITDQHSLLICKLAAYGRDLFTLRNLYPAFCPAEANVQSGL